MAKLKPAQQQANERLEALRTEQQARKDDLEGNKQALAELRDEYRERLLAKAETRVARL